LKFPVGADHKRTPDDSNKTELACWLEDLPFWAVCVYLLVNWRALYQFRAKVKQINLIFN